MDKLIQGLCQLGPGYQLSPSGASAFHEHLIDTLSFVNPACDCSSIALYRLRRRVPQPQETFGSRA